jgi:hypothetical protein
MNQPEKTSIKKQLTLEQTKEIMSYPVHWRNTLEKAAERGESIKETYERLKGLEAFM